MSTPEPIQPQLYPCLGCEQLNFDEQGNCRTCAASEPELNVEAEWGLIDPGVKHLHEMESAPPKLDGPNLTLRISTLALCNCDGFWHFGSPARYLGDYVWELIEEARTQERYES